jgi:hypothetical protein
MNNTPIFQNTEITQNYIEKDGCFEIHYNRNKKQFEVFTVPTQRFYVNSLEELTLERFMLEEERQKQYQKGLAEMFRLYHEEQEKNENE